MKRKLIAAGIIAALVVAGWLLVNQPQSRRAILNTPEATLAPWWIRTPQAMATLKASGLMPAGYVCNTSECAFNYAQCIQNSDETIGAYPCDADKAINRLGTPVPFPSGYPETPTVGVTNPPPTDIDPPPTNTFTSTPTATPTATNMPTATRTATLTSVGTQVPLCIKNIHTKALNERPFASVSKGVSGITIPVGVTVFVEYTFENSEGTWARINYHTFAAMYLVAYNTTYAIVTACPAP